MDPAQARSRFAAARVARLATVTPDQRPHIVPITFALIGPDRIVTAVDDKPKRTRALVRLRNVEANPEVAVLADHYDDDWQRLWWVRADGIARVQTTAETTALIAKYAQYRDRPPSGPFIEIEVNSWSGWSAVS
jgi:PPOX class probable F420-dependent enzyme